jgi:hypothetical protein
MRVLLKATNGSWNICASNKYPLSFLKMHHIKSSCTTELRKNVMRVAVCLEIWNVLMLEW